MIEIFINLVLLMFYMDKNSLKKEEEEFLQIGKQKDDKENVIEKKIHKSNNQYSVKIPKKHMEALGYQEGDKIVFKLVKPFKVDEKPRWEITYKKNGTKSD